MEIENVEIIYNWLDNTVKIIEESYGITYLEGISIALNLLVDPTYLDGTEGNASKQIVIKNAPKIESFSKMDLRKAFQLIVLKGMKDNTQANHLMTPEAIALLVAYFSEKLMNNEKEIRVFDPVCGSGNLITTVVNQLRGPVKAYGSEIDPTLIQIAAANSNLQKIDMTLFHQDSLTPFLLDPVDLVVADLPVGYYPDDQHAKSFELNAEEGHAYAHHLLIEQSLNYTKEDGYLILLIPEFLFSSDQASKLHAFIQEQTNIIGLLKLPDSAFVNKKNAKSIFIIQKKGVMKGPKQPLLVNLPSFKNTAGMNDILDQINDWFKVYLAEIK